MVLLSPISEFVSQIWTYFFRYWCPLCSQIAVFEIRQPPIRRNPEPSPPSNSPLYTRNRSEGLPERDISSLSVMGWGLEAAGKLFRRRLFLGGGQKKMKFWFFSWRPPVGADRSVSSRRYGRTSWEFFGIKDKLKLFKRVQKHRKSTNVAKSENWIVFFWVGGLRMARIDPSLRGGINEPRGKMLVLRKEQNI